MAKETGIDAFALNCAPTRVDSYTPRQLANAYEAAAALNFLLFISFDFNYWNEGDSAEIRNFLNLYASHPAQMQYDGGAVVSTFVGDTFNWAPIKAAVNKKLFAIPHQIDPYGPRYLNTNFDGVFSWQAWHSDGHNGPAPGSLTTAADQIYMDGLNGKPYMARKSSKYLCKHMTDSVQAVSPWFFTHFSYKNWVFVCEKVITERWNQMLALKPALIQVISWNGKLYLASLDWLRSCVVVLTNSRLWREPLHWSLCAEPF